MRHFTRILPILAIICGTVAAQHPAQAGAYTYSGKQKQINCGIVVVDPNNQPLNAASAGGVGDLFYLLDNLASMKPAGWTLENPFTGVADNSIRKYGKNEVEYWEVNLASVRDLSRMHALYLPAEGQITLDDEAREKLRRFVDGGGVLWVDNCGTAGTALTFGPASDPGTFFIPYFGFNSTSPAGQDYPMSRHHPLLTIPYWLTEQDIAMLGPSDRWGKLSVEPGYDLSPPPDPPDRFEFLFPVVGHAVANSLPSVASNAYGSGRVVASANFVGRGCFLNYPFSLPSLKFAYNVLAISSTWTNARKDPRHSGGSIDTVGGTKLAKIWSHKAAPSGIECAPVVYKNVVFYSSGHTLFALDLKPQEDLDHDGNIDDGDTTLVSNGQDIIWLKDDFDGTISSPTIVTAQDPTTPGDPGNAVDAVLVLSSTGKVYMLDAFPRVTPTGPLSSKTRSLLGTDSADEFWNVGAGYANPHPPMYINGWIYVAGSDGRIHAMNPVLYNYQKSKSGPPHIWDFPSSNIGFSAEIKTGPSFGYVTSQNSGAVIGVLYWGTSAPTIGAGPPPSQNDVVFGVPINARHDRLRVKRVDVNVAECQIALRSASIASSPPPMVWGYYVDATGTRVDIPITDVDPNNGNRPGYIKITSSLPIPPDAVFYADYSLDYSTQAVVNAAFPNIRQYLEPQSAASGTIPTTIPATPALGPNAMVYITGERTVPAGSLQAGGSVYGLQMDGSNQITKWNYFLHAGLESTTLMGASGSDLVTIPNLAGASMVIPGVVMKKMDNGSGWLPLQNLQALSSPAYSGDKVFVTVSGQGQGGALLCFKANPDFVIRVTENAGFDLSGTPIRRPKSLYDVTNNRPVSVKIWQPNLLDMSISGGPLSDAIPVPKDMIDYDKGTITFDRFDRLKLKYQVGQQPNIFSPSLPVWVLLDNVEVPIDFSTWGPMSAFGTQQQLANDAVDLSGWNNLLWYYSVNSEVHSSPVVIGDTVYFETDDGTLYAINAETGETRGKAVGDDKVIWTQDDTSGLNMQCNTSIAGSNGVLLIPKPDGLYAYSNTTTLVADTNRLMELDGAGELSWAADSITWPARVPPSINQQPVSTAGPVNKPSRVRYIGSGEMLVANSGANQVCRIDKSARVGSLRVKSTGPMGDVFIRWLYDKFSDPKRLLRPGQPTHLVGPTDAVLWEEPEKDSDGVTCQMVHCLIADSGNHRIVDLVYKFKIDNNERVLVAGNSDIDPDSGFCMPRLNWVTTTDTTNERYVFDCIQLVPNYNATTYLLESFDIWAAVSNYRTGTGGVASNEGLGGAIVAIRYRVPNSGMWDYASANSGQIVNTCDRMRFPAPINGIAPLASPRYFQVTDTPAGRFLYVCDNYGVYKASFISNPPTVSEMLWDAEVGSGIPSYRAMDRNSGVIGNQYLGVPLQASCVHVLPNQNWLITNSYSGTDKQGTANFSGEVFEYSPITGEIEWHSPDLEWYADFSWKQRIGNGQIPQQPSCAYRQF